MGVFGQDTHLDHPGPLQASRPLNRKQPCKARLWIQAFTAVIRLAFFADRSDRSVRDAKQRRAWRSLVRIVLESLHPARFGRQSQ